MTIIIFFIILAILVLVHELGHFLAAKKAGIKVEEFGFGFPPRLWSIKKGETIYSINWIPFGGFVKILGENALEGNEGPVLAADRGRSLSEKPRHIQAGVLAAGVFFNILLAWMILSFGLWFGLPTSREGVPQGYRLEQSQLLVVDVVKGSPAETAGLKNGSVISYLSDGKTKISQPGISDVQKFVADHNGQSITIGYLNDAKSTSAGLEKVITLRPETGSSGGPAVIGIAMDEIGILKLPLLVSIWEGLRLTALVGWAIVVALWGLLVGIFQGQTAVLSSVTGPVGLVGIIGTSLSFGFSYLLNLVAVISLNLAVINFLPFPALDGGRIMFLAIEAIRRKALNPKIVNSFNLAGFYLLLALMAVLTYRDIWHLFSR